MNTNIPLRKVFTETLLELARNDSSIVAVVSDSRGSVTLESFAEELPQQFVDVGIAEQNAVGIGAGLAKGGKKVFVCAPSCFLTARSSEQIKVDVAYCQSNVKIMGVSGGVTYGSLGATHHSIHDIALVRAIPGMSVILPSDARQTVAMTKALADYKGPVYVRFGRDAVPDIYEDESGAFEMGKANVVMEGGDITIVGTGETVNMALDTAALLKKEGVSTRVIDLHTIKPLDEETIVRAARETGCVITIEDHNIYCGLGGAVAETIVQNCPVPMRIIGIPDEPAIAGTKEEVFQHYGMTPDDICAVAMQMLEKRD